MADVRELGKRAKAARPALGRAGAAQRGRALLEIAGVLEREGELRLVETAGLPEVAVLVAGHHGSDTSNTLELLEALKPSLALISVGQNNKYGHPGWDTLVRLDEIGADIYRTDLYGTIEIQLNES